MSRSLHMPCSLEQIVPCSNILFSGARILNMHPTAKRLLEIGLENGAETFTDIAKALDATDQSATNWKTRGVPKDKIIAASALYGANASYLRDGTLPRYLSPSPDTQAALKPAEFDSNVTSVPFGKRPIPVISYVQAGLLSDINDPYAPGDGFAIEICEDDLGRFAFALEIEGDSMLPEFRPGDRVIIDPDVNPMPGDFVVAKNSHQKATFKKFRPRGMNEQGTQVFELVPLNEDYPTMRSDIEQLRIIGTMVEHRKKYRRKA